jgi:hypothetical protein
MNKFGMAILAVVLLVGCVPVQPSSDQVQQDQQEKILQEGNAEAGMPNIVNFREKKALKDIFELRDQAKFITYTYYFNEISGKVGDEVCQSIGYPIPGATQYTNPSKIERYEFAGGYASQVIPQADPNGLFSPSNEDATWVLCNAPDGSGVKPVYVEPKVICSPWKLK